MMNFFILTYLRVGSLNPLPVVLLEELVGCQVLVVSISVFEVDVVEAEVFANF